METLDCGHAPTATDGCGTGYGQDAEGRRYCYDCCAERERAAMIQTGKTSLYLVKSADGMGYEATDWPGKLRFRVSDMRRSFHNFAGRNGRTDFWFWGPDGFKWHGVNIGDMQLARVYRTKQRLRLAEIDPRLAGRAAA